jgi:hypothetical protein
MTMPFLPDTEGAKSAPADLLWPLPAFAEDALQTLAFKRLKAHPKFLSDLFKRVLTLKRT